MMFNKEQKSRKYFQMFIGTLETLWVNEISIKNLKGQLPLFESDQAYILKCKENLKLAIETVEYSQETYPAWLIIKKIWTKILSVLDDFSIESNWNYERCLETQEKLNRVIYVGQYLTALMFENSFIQQIKAVVKLKEIKVRIIKSRHIEKSFSLYDLLASIENSGI